MSNIILRVLQEIGTSKSMTSKSMIVPIDSENNILQKLLEVKRVLVGTGWILCDRSNIPQILEILKNIGLKCHLSYWKTIKESGVEALCVTSYGVIPDVPESIRSKIIIDYIEDLIPNHVDCTDLTPLI